MIRHAVVGGFVAVLLAGASSASVLSAQPAAATYPEIYRARKLPELPGATIVSTGRQTKSLRDGIRLRLTSPAPLAEIRDFYQAALTTRGWKEDVSQASRAAATNPRLSMMTFVGEGVTYSVVITAGLGTSPTQILVNVLDRAPAVVPKPKEK